MNARQRRFHPTEYLDHILSALRLAQNYVEGFSKDDFLADKKTQQAVILNIMVVGEAATQILDEHPEFAARHPDVPWKQIRGMRNRMAHGYFEINLDIVWDTVRTALPKLERQILSIQQEPPESTT
ncbi:MAG: DUF86 domain-containing protein [Nitrospinae bacterium]|nr:DUF86 domain-containing protein [Nitrospinota bacterium]